MRIMGLDYGTKTVGVAISDDMMITAQPVETIVRERANKLRKTYQRIEELISQNDVEKIVIGKPLNMNGTEGEMVQLMREFSQELSRRTGLEIIEVDERLTTSEADRILKETGVAISGRKEHIDKMAAAIILQTYLDMNKELK
ncbi:MAG: Holliday junction resolvase RuvX [Eubacterium sp.]|nr:Holliday junction resolvase RuvX [Eubacterium sp.]